MKILKNCRFLVCILLIFVLFSLINVISTNIASASTEEVVGTGSRSKQNIEIDSKENFNSAVLDNTIDNAKFLYNYDGSPDYLFVQFNDGGYAILANGSNEILEYSPSESMISDFTEPIVYGGPNNYYVQSSNVYTNISSKNSITINSHDVYDLSCNTRELFNIDVQPNDLYLSKSNVSSDNIIEEKFPHKKISYTSPSSVPPLDENNLISPTKGATYIKNADYFLEDPTHGTNNGTSCTTVATQLMLSYNNYYNDRRLIPDRYLNGTKTTDPQDNPNYCDDPMLVSKETLGSNQLFHDDLFDRGVTSFPIDAKDALNSYLVELNTHLDNKITYSIKCKDSFPSVVSTSDVLAELNADRPVVLSTEETLNGTVNTPNRDFNHSVLAYGYQYLAPYENGTSYLGYIVHFGWTSSTNQIWTNSAWYYTYLSLQINHTHNFYRVGSIKGDPGRTEYKCNICGYRTDGSREGETPTEVYVDISNMGKSGNTWNIKVENLQDTPITVYYNSKMCFLDDAKNWNGLVDVKAITLSGRQSKNVTISENVFATSIALCYLTDNERFITYADQLSPAKDIYVRYNRKVLTNYQKNNMKVNIAGKNGGTWLIELTNNTGSGRTFDYNTKMCFAGDAKNWTSLSDPGQVYLANGSISNTLYISENGTADSIAISYLDGKYRKIFYAFDLNASGTMTANASEIDTTNPPPASCITEGILITLADGTQKSVEELTGNERLLVWNMYTGTFDSAPILCIDSDPIGHYESILLSFADGTTVDVLSEHGFFDVDLNKYVYLDEYAADYIGHDFLKQSENGMTAVTLVDVEVSTGVTVAYSPVTYGHLCYFVNGMLSMPGGIDGLFNIFEVDSETMMYDAEAMVADIEKYGLYTYEELNALVSVPEVMFNAVNGQYLKVAVGKDIITIEQIGELVERYADLFE